MSLVQKLLSAPLDIVGDIHGELGALKSLIMHLGYDEDGFHHDKRKLVFVGDLVDRGPDSPGVVKFVKRLVDNGNAQVILGNHELNLLKNDAKNGSGWYFEDQYEKDEEYYPFNVAKGREREEVYNFLSGLPLALESESLRVVHASWIDSDIEVVRRIPLGSVVESFLSFERDVNQKLIDSGVFEKLSAEKRFWNEKIKRADIEVPFLDNISKYDIAHQMGNPIRVLTSGVEVAARTPFFVNGKWRFVKRDAWWDNYDGDIPVVVGHFWRKLKKQEVVLEEDLFSGVGEVDWHGLNNNVFCVDYSVGARFLERKNGLSCGENSNLAALRWPENELWFENGCVLNSNFDFSAKKNKI